MKHVFIPQRSPEWHQWRQKGITATEAAVDCVNSGSLLTVPMNVCERLCAADHLAKLLVCFYSLQ